MWNQSCQFWQLDVNNSRAGTNQGRNQRNFDLFCSISSLKSTLFGVFFLVGFLSDFVQGRDVHRNNSRARGRESWEEQNERERERQMSKWCLLGFFFSEKFSSESGYREHPWATAINCELTRSSTATFRDFQTNSHTAMTQATPIPPISTTKTPPTLASPSSLAVELDLEVSSFRKKEKRGTQPLVAVRSH